jgi:N-hydroxyarylamine O-acetyltransferase
MQRAHRLTVPFESLDIHVGRRLSIDGDHLFDKIVRQRRGGWCHELNGLWARALRHLGFQVEVIAAQVIGPSTVPKPFGHCTTIVQLDEPWWSDVGFGVRPPRPVRLEHSGPQLIGDWEIEFSNTGDTWTMRSEVPGAPQQLGLQFSRQPRDFEEFRETMEWQQTSPESLFTQRPVCVLFTEDGRITLAGDTLTITRGEEREQHTAATPDELDDLLLKHFGIELGEHTWRGFPWRPA